MADICFRPLEHADLPLMCAWLNSPQVIQWFGKRAVTPDGVREHYAPYITASKPTRAYIIVIKGVDAGYIQTYLYADYPEFNAYIEADESTAGVDVFIGEPSLIHKGWGEKILRQFLAEKVYAGGWADKCIIGPEPANTAAIRMYSKAGFTHLRTIQVPDEDAPEYLMIHYCIKSAEPL